MDVSKLSRDKLEELYYDLVFDIKELDTDNKELKQQIINLEKEIKYLKNILESVPNSMENSDYSGESE